ncbi:MAG: hypothetical protein ACRC0G_07565 [Fusobacteriaceae bacterium]
MIKVYYDDCIVTSGRDPEKIINEINNLGRNDIWLDHLEVHLVFPNSMVRVVDYETILRCRNLIVTYMETSYYSGQDDGSFTLFDSVLLEDLFPELYSVTSLDNDQVIVNMSNKLDENMDARLVSANHAVIEGVYSIVDSLFFINERPSYLYVHCPQRDSLEFVVSHIIVVDAASGDFYKVSDIDRLFEIVFSDKVLTNIDMNRI